jgi:ribosomal protein S18 acetylase RimI-like enzyme
LEDTLSAISSISGVSNTIEIIDAKELGLEETKKVINTIFKNAFSHEKWRLTPDVYVHKYYFKETTYEERLFSCEFNFAEKILLAKVGEIFEGFIISSFHEKDDKRFAPDTTYVEWLGVNKGNQGKGIGTQLLLTMMKISKAMEKKFLNLSFRFGGFDVDAENAKKTAAFYERFAEKRQLKCKEGSPTGDVRMGMRTLDFDLSTLK